MVAFEINVNRKVFSQRALRSMALSLFSILLPVGCHSESDTSLQSSHTDNSSRTPIEIHMTDMPNKTILDQANAAGEWFHARKTRPIWTKRLETAQAVKTLEGEEQVEAGHYLCRGEAGDIWPQTEKDLNRRYTATDEVDADDWRMYQPNPDAEGVMAMQIDHPFAVETSWGQLSGKAGDYLLKNFHDSDTAYPADVWIVDQTLFGQTYTVVHPDG